MQSFKKNIESLLMNPSEERFPEDSSIKFTVLNFPEVNPDDLMESETYKSIESKYSSKFDVNQLLKEIRDKTFK